MKYQNYKAKEILIKAKKDVFSGNIGSNLTTFKGDGLDFKEISQYSYGDDIRRINWKATAKSGNINDIKINLFNQEQELNIIIVFFVSGSMKFGSVRFKLDVAAEILALLSYSAIKNNNILQTLFFSTKVENYYPPTKNQFIINDTVEDILNLECINKEVDYNKFCEYINTINKLNGKKSLIFMIGDFYDIDKLDFSQISFDNELYALIVRDKFEEYPYIDSLADSINLIDLNNNQTQELFLNKKIAKKYKALINENDKLLKKHFLQYKISYGKIYTSSDFDNVYLELVNILK